MPGGTSFTAQCAQPVGGPGGCCVRRATLRFPTGAKRCGRPRARPVWRRPSRRASTPIRCGPSCSPTRSTTPSAWPDRSVGCWPGCWRECLVRCPMLSCRVNGGPACPWCWCRCRHDPTWCGRGVMIRCCGSPGRPRRLHEAPAEKSVSCRCCVSDIGWRTRLASDWRREPRTCATRWRSTPAAEGSWRAGVARFASSSAMTS